MSRRSCRHFFQLAHIRLIAIILVLPLLLTACSLFTWNSEELVDISIDNRSSLLLYYVDRSSIVYMNVYLEPDTVTPCDVPRNQELDLYIEQTGELYQSIMIGGLDNTTYVVN
jgi:hypothetical protein